MTVYLPGYRGLRERANKVQWRAMKPLISVANNHLHIDFEELMSEHLDEAQAIMTRMKGDKDPAAVSLSLRNRFVDHANALIAEHALAVAPFRRAPNKDDERAALPGPASPGLRRLDGSLFRYPAVAAAK